MNEYRKQAVFKNNHICGKITDYYIKDTSLLSHMVSRVDPKYRGIPYHKIHDEIDLGMGVCGIVGYTDYPMKEGECDSKDLGKYLYFFDSEESKTFYLMKA